MGLVSLRAERFYIGVIYGVDFTQRITHTQWTRVKSGRSGGAGGARTDGTSGGGGGGAILAIAVRLL